MTIKRRTRSRPRHTDWETVLAVQLDAVELAFDREFCAIPKRKFRFDFKVWRQQFPGRFVLVEVQGAVYVAKSGHRSATGVIRDCEKFSLAAVHGYRVLPVTPEHINSGKAITWIQKALA